MTLGPAVRRLGRVATAIAGAALAAEVGRRRHARSRGLPRVPVSAADLPDWVLPTDVVASQDEAEEHGRLSDGLGLPLVVDEVAAWAALGALATLVRIVDDGTRSSTVLDLGGRRSAIGRWCRAAGFDVVREIPVERGSVDLMTRLHPAPLAAEGVDDLLEVAAVLLRPGGAVVLTVPVGGADAPGAMGRADLRALEARAHELGLVLVGDLDGEVGRRLTRAVREADLDAQVREPGAAFALARLTLRRR